MQAKVCISTKKRIDNDEGSVTFLCPKCGDYEIVRSSFARVNGLKYTCPKCEFTGPN
ncbi:MAG: zinc finger domain-containing protein [Nanoarchaeota archaeon]|nr:zinc finger domain-containing protein [Nanoarchaeota archaeon]